MNIYRYKIELDIEGETKFETGIIPESSLYQATLKIGNYFGNKLVAIHMLKEIGNSQLISLSEEMIDKIEEGWIW